MADLTNAVVQGMVRGGVNDGTAQIMRLNEKFEQIISQGFPAYTEMTRRKNSWATMSTSAVAGLVVRPSTTAAFEIFNGYSTGGKSLIVDRLFWFNLVSTNVIEGFSGWAGVTIAKTAPSNGNFAVKSNMGQTYTGPVIAAASTTIVDPGWFPWGNAYNKGAGGVVPFGAISEKVEGRLIVPPQCSLVMHVVSSLVGQTFTQGASWFEEQIDNA